MCQLLCAFDFEISKRQILAVYNLYPVLVAIGALTNEASKKNKRRKSMSAVAAILGFLSTILSEIFWLMITNALPGSIGPLYHLAAIVISLIVGFTVYHNLSTS